MTTEDRTIEVTIDHRTSFPALITDQRWNGWLCPRFDRATTEHVAAWLNQQHRADPGFFAHARWDGPDLLITETGHGTTRLTPGPDGRYPLGAGAWCWDHTDPR